MALADVEPQGLLGIVDKGATHANFFANLETVQHSMTHLNRQPYASYLAENRSD